MDNKICLKDDLMHPCTTHVFWMLYRPTHCTPAALPRCEVATRRRPATRLHSPASALLELPALGVGTLWLAMQHPNANPFVHRPVHAGCAGRHCTGVVSTANMTMLLHIVSDRNVRQS